MIPNVSAGPGLKISVPRCQANNNTTEAVNTRNVHNYLVDFFSWEICFKTWLCVESAKVVLLTGIVFAKCALTCLYRLFPLWSLAIHSVFWSSYIHSNQSIAIGIWWNPKTHNSCNYIARYNWIHIMMIIRPFESIFFTRAQCRRLTTTFNAFWQCIIFQDGAVHSFEMSCTELFWNADCSQAVVSWWRLM